MIKRPKWLKRSLATYNPFLYTLIVQIKRMERYLRLLLDNHKYSRSFAAEGLNYRVKKHQSVLIRKTSNDEDFQLQINKVENLKIVIQQIDSVLIKPGETFSFYKLVGKPIAKRGFIVGMELSQGCARPGVGGGICQASNLIYWLALHSPLEVVERHHHSFDPFPDENRVLPFASGATVMYNYRDLRLRNNTPHTFQIKLWLDNKCLNGDLRCSNWLTYSYTVYEKNHRFEEKKGKYFRANELWRKKLDKKSGKILDREFIVSNYAEVKYVPSPEKLQTDSAEDN